MDTKPKMTIIRIQFIWKALTSLSSWQIFWDLQSLHLGLPKSLSQEQYQKSKILPICFPLNVMVTVRNYENDCLFHGSVAGKSLRQFADSCVSVNRQKSMDAPQTSLGEPHFEHNNISQCWKLHPADHKALLTWWNLTPSLFYASVASQILYLSNGAKKGAWYTNASS